LFLTLFFLLCIAAELGLRHRGLPCDERICTYSSIFTHYKSLSNLFADEIFKGTVSRDGFGFRGHAWSVPGLNRWRGQFLHFLLGAPVIF
jgi:hypothetical protein